MVVLSNNKPNKKWKPLLDFIHYEINSAGLIRDVRSNKILLQYNRQARFFLACRILLS